MKRYRHDSLKNLLKNSIPFFVIKFFTDGPVESYWTKGWAISMKEMWMNGTRRTIRIYSFRSWNAKFPGQYCSRSCTWYKTWSWWLRKYKGTSNGNKISSSWRYEDRRRHSFAASFPRRLMPGLRVKRVQRRFDFPRCLYRYPPRDPLPLLSSLPGQEFVLRFRFSGRLVLLWPCTYRLHQKSSR